MKSWVSGVLIGVFALVGAGCSTAGGGSGAGLETLDAPALAKLFKGGSKHCKWTAGGTKGEDFYYTTGSMHAGDADRNVGSSTLQGTWMVKGDQLCLDLGTRECVRLHEAGKKDFKAIGADGNVAREMTCS